MPQPHSPELDTITSRPLVRLALLSAGFGALHHADHVVRSNHVGWPVIPEVTPFTFSLVVYPLLLGGAWVARRRGISPWYWVVVSLATAALVTNVHFNPDPRNEQVKDLYLPYAETPAYCAHRSNADSLIGPSVLCDPASPARPFLGVLSVAVMLALALTLWTFVVMSVRELLRSRRAHGPVGPATRTTPRS